MSVWAYCLELGTGLVFAQTAFSLYTGPSIFAAVLLLAFLMPINAYVVSRQRTLQTNNLQYKDIRIRLYNEILNGIKVRLTEHSANN